MILAVGSFGALPIPGDAQEGEELFKSQQCIQCHSIDGKGGTLAPDLGRRVGRSYTPALMASLMWNHAPAMWSAMERAGVAKPQLTTEQAADLFAYFYAVRYFEQPGDAGRGKRVFRSKRCNECHGLAEPLATGIKPVAQWKSLTDPILLAQEMWNHSAQMKEAFAKRNIPWPRLTGQELTDLLVYLRNLPETRGREMEFAPASSETGAMLFKLKNCAGCHTGRMSLENRFTNRSLADFAAAMWNHSRQMPQYLPDLGAEEMRRIVGYLWSVQLFDQPGNPRRGKNVYTSKKCAACHEDAASGAPKITARPDINTLTLVSDLWKHGPAMLERMQQKGIEWPRFGGSDMADLIAWLNQGQ